MTPAHPLKRPDRKLRDDRLFTIATEDAYAAKQYLEALPTRRVAVVVLPTDTAENRSSPKHLLERARKAIAEATKAKTRLPDDQAWLVLDTDHWVEANHVQGFANTLSEARKAGICVAVSNPCFEAWLYLHCDELPSDISGCGDLIQRLKAKLGGYNKTRIDASRFLPGVAAAVRRAAATPRDGWPQTPGSQVVHLVRELGAHEPV